MVAELAERGNMKVVRANVPLANMFQYVSALRSLESWFMCKYYFLSVRISSK